LIKGDFNSNLIPSTPNSTPYHSLSLSSPSISADRIRSGALRHSSKAISACEKRKQLPMALKLLKELKAGRGLPLKNLGNLISVTIPQMIYFSGWWFQTWLLFGIIYGIILPIH
jgi:hypothetical protein